MESPGDTVRTPGAVGFFLGKQMPGGSREPRGVYSLMNKQGRIEEGGSGIGAPTPAEVEQRARELALIAGRAHPNASDRRNARAELTGSGFYGEEDAFTSWASRPDATGHKVETADEGDRSVGEELVEEGVDEALHDEMLEARHPEGER